jgi:ABC-2 type transport system ATP-binding protein
MIGISIGTDKAHPETDRHRHSRYGVLCQNHCRSCQTLCYQQKQRLGIAQALLADPKLLICDEPTSALDPVGRKEILDILYKIRGTTTVLFSTHILSDVERICDHVALLNDGYIAVGGTLSEIKALHSHDSLLIEFSSEADLQQFKASMAKQPLLIGSEEKGREMIIHSREIKKAQHTIFSTLAEADLAPVKVALMEPSLESLFLEVIK